eukprot:5797999-Pleurochrysis_carterae.AAC.1
MGVREARRVSFGARVAWPKFGPAERGRRVRGDVGQAAQTSIAGVEPTVHVFGGVRRWHGVYVRRCASGVNG